MKISVITPLINRSGVPLSQLRLANSLHDRGHDVTLITGNIYDNRVIMDLNKKIKICNLKKKIQKECFGQY